MYPRRRRGTTAPLANRGASEYLCVMHPYLISIDGPNGPAGVPFYGVMIMLAFTLGFIHVQLRAPRIGVHPERLMGVYLSAAVGGLVGARVLYLIAVEGPLALLNPSALFAAGGFAYYGGVLGGAAAVFALAYLKGMNGWKLADLLAPALVLGLGVGRLACFFAGCCHGAEAPVSPELVHLVDPGFLHGVIYLDPHFPWITTEFFDGVGRLKRVPLYPTQLWSVTAGLSLWALLTVVWTRRRFDGQVAGLMLILEPIARIFIESFRADQRGYAVRFPVPQAVADWLPGLTEAGEHLNGATAGLTTSQTIGLTMMVAGALILATGPRRGLAAETPIEAPED